MNFKLGKAGEVKLIYVYEDSESVSEGNELFQYLRAEGLFKAKAGELYSNINHREKLLFLGLGKRDKLSLETIRKSFFNAGEKLMKVKAKSIQLELSEFENIPYIDGIKSIVEGLLQSEYSFEKYLSDKKIIPSIEDVYLEAAKDKEEEIKEAIREIEILVEGIFLARDLVNERSIKLTPRVLADNAREELEKLKVKVSVYGEKEIEELEMGAFLAVAKGSSEEAQLIVMEYEGDSESEERLALVGKGVTFDTGGYSLKPAASMETMFTDMAGAASVIGAMKAIAKAKLKRNVVALVAACENTVSGKAYKPGDIVRSMSGKTVEVLNTDAEGRLTLADALWYAAKNLRADKIVDVATLTGACIIALGHINTGAITNDDNFMNEVKAASQKAGEAIWTLPSNDEYREQIRGDFADLKNTGGRPAGTITAGLFLEEFVDNTPWVHLDIAGTSYLPKKQAYLPKGATGIPVKTLYYLAKN